MTFQRENRYIVIKRKDLKNVPVNYRTSLVDPMFQLLAHLPTRECLVIESDWPEYEPAWRMIQARVEGTTLSPAHIEDGEEVEVVGTLIIGEQGWDNAIELNPGPVMALADAHPKSAMPLMTVAQHQRIVAARSCPCQTDTARETRRKDGIEAAELQGILMRDYEACRPRDAGLMGWAAAALSAPHEQAELWAVHVEGPDDLYAAFSREDAERHASELNAIPTPDGISISAVVIPSPWGAVEHWQYLAEQEREHVESMRAALSAPPAADGMCNADNPASRCECREEFGHRVCKAPPAAGVPEGWKLVPIEPTDAMLEIGAQCVYEPTGKEDIGDVWSNMLIEAPTPPASEQQRAVVMPEKQVEYVGDRDHKLWASGANWMLREFLRLNPHLAKGEGV
ncbi:hypothetical protein [Metapseudomonas otitidis]|uniref:hypothetical protein n=1 Tax=Metapseudomonas otitidis TaxID=319939 RepID=UPI00366FA5A3